MPGLKLHAEPLQESWLDNYGHLNEAFYLVPFSNASWAFQDHFDIGIPYFEKTGGSLYTAESHIRYLSEVRAPAHIEIESFALQCDAKKIHFAHIMRVDGTERATFECLGVHFDSKSGRTSPMPESSQAAIAAACLPQDEWPDWIGRRISMSKKPASA